MNVLHILKKAVWRGSIILLLVAACGRLEETPAPVPEEATITPSIAASDTPSIPGPTSTPSVPLTLPTSPFQMPLDLVELEPANANLLQPYGQLTFDRMPNFIPDASIAFSDLEYTYTLAAHLDDGELIVWDIATGAMLATDWSKRGGGQTGSYAALGIRPAYDQYLATSATAYLDEYADLQSVVYLWEMDGLGEPVMLPGTSPYGDRSIDPMGVMSVAFSPDGGLLAAGIRLGEGQGGLVRIWELSENTLLQELNFEDAVSDVDFSPGGTLFITAGNRLIYVDLAIGEKLQQVGYEFTLEGLAISPGGGWLAVYGEQAVLVESSSRDTKWTIPASETINALAFSPQESLLAIADGNNLRFWDLASGVEVANVQGQSKYLDVDFFQNGRIIATIDEQAQVLLWGVQAHLTLPAEHSTISTASVAALKNAAQLFVPKIAKIAFSGKSDWMALSSTDGVYMIDLPALTLRELLPQSGRYSAVFDASSDGRWLAWVPESGAVNIRDAVDDSLAYELTDLDETCCRKVQLSPSGYLLTLSDAMEARIWDLQTLQEIYSREAVQNAEFSPDGTQVAFESAMQIKVTIWDIATRQVVRELTGYETAAPLYATKFSPTWNSMFWVARAHMQFTDVESGQLGPEVTFSWGDFTPDGTHAALVEDGWYYNTVGQVHLIDVNTGQSVAVFDYHEDDIVDALAFSPDGRMLATALGNTIKIWDVARGTELISLQNAAGPIFDLLFSPDGRLLAALAAGHLVDFWVVPKDAVAMAPAIAVNSASSVRQIDEINIPESPTDAVYSPGGDWIAITTQDGVIYLWDYLAEQRITFQESHTGWVYQAAFSQDGRWLATASQDGTVGLWDVNARRMVGSVFGSRGGEFSSLAFHPLADVLIAGGQMYSMIAWKIPSLEQLWSETGASANWIWDLAISEDGMYLARASANDKAYTRTLENLEERPALQGGQIFEGHGDTVWSVDFSPDGRYLATGSWDGTVRLWDVDSSETIHVMAGHTDWVYDVAFSPDGTLLASSSRNGDIRLWEVATGQELAVLSDHTARVWSVDFSPDGLYLASASDDGTVRIWGVLP